MLAASGRPPKMTRTCSHCGASNAPSACVACKAAFYCAVPCQRAHWPAHRAPCRAHAAAWLSADAVSYGAWAPRLHDLLSERPTYGTLVISRDDVTCGGQAWPLRGVTSLTSPHLAPSVALEVLALAGEARAAAGSAPSAAARRSLLCTAFSLALLAASPDSGTPPPAHLGSLPSSALPTDGEVSAVVARVLRAVSSPAMPPGCKRWAGGGNAEAQYLVGLAYYTGQAPTCPRGARLDTPAVFWVLLAAAGGHAPARAWLQRMGIRCV